MKKENREKEIEVHEALNCHDWVYMSAERLQKFGANIVSRDRRICRGCRKVQFCWGIGPWVVRPDGTEDWQTETSSIAKPFMEKILEGIDEGVCRP